MQAEKSSIQTQGSTQADQSKIQDKILNKKSQSGFEFYAAHVVLLSDGGKTLPKSRSCEVLQGIVGSGEGVVSKHDNEEVMVHNTVQSECMQILAQ